MNERLMQSEGIQSEAWTRERVAKLIDDLKDVSGHLDLNEEYIESIGKVRVKLQDALDKFPNEQRSSRANNRKESVWDKLSPKRKKEKFEVTHTLGGPDVPSDFSAKGWEVFHPKFESSTKYEDTGNDIANDFNECLYFSDSTKGDNPVLESTDICINKYMDSVGNKRVLFNIGEFTQKVSGGTKYWDFKSRDKRIARLDFSNEIVTDVIAFRNRKTGIVFHVKIKYSGNGNLFEITNVKPVKIDQK